MCSFAYTLSIYSVIHTLIQVIIDLYTHTEYIYVLSVMCTTVLVHKWYIQWCTINKWFIISKRWKRMKDTWRWPSNSDVHIIDIYSVMHASVLMHINNRFIISKRWKRVNSYVKLSQALYNIIKSFSHESNYDLIHLFLFSCNWF